MEKKKCAILGARSTQRFFRSKDKRPPGFSRESSSSQGKGRNSCFLLRKHWEPKGRQFTHQVVALTQVLPPDLLLRCGVLSDSSRKPHEEHTPKLWAQCIWMEKCHDRAGEPKSPMRASLLAQNSPWEMQTLCFPQGGRTRKGIAPEHWSPREAVQDSAHSSQPKHVASVHTPSRHTSGWSAWPRHKAPFIYSHSSFFFRFNFTLLGEFGPISLCLSSCFQKKKNRSISAQHLWIILHSIKASRWLTASEEPWQNTGLL